MQKTWILTLVSWLVSSTLSEAVILYGTGDTNANTSAPTGDLAGSGWEFQGLWGDYLGTAIAPEYFITAKHVGGAISNTFTLGGTNYTVIASYPHPCANNDLTIWKISGIFPSFAQLYGRQDEHNKGLVVFGRGTQRGDPVYHAPFGGNLWCSPVPSAGLVGWKWGPADKRLRWGENSVFVGPLSGAGDQECPWKEFILGPFDQNAGTNEAALSTGDSGGGVFIQETSGSWKLAGLNFGLLFNEFRTNVSSSSFNASVFYGDLLYPPGSPGTGSVFCPSAVQSHFAATRVSTNVDWILGVIGTIRLHSGVSTANGFEFKISGSTTNSITVEGSTNLVNWTTVATVGPSNSTISVRDSAATNMTARFYRAQIDSSHRSINSHGFYKKTVAAGSSTNAKVALIACQLTHPTGNKMANVLSSPAIGTMFYKSNELAGGWTTNLYTTVSGTDTWTLPNMSLEPGEGGWLYNYSTNAQTFTFVGDVPLGTLVNKLPGSIAIRSSLVPQAGAIDTVLGLNPALNMQVYRWTNDNYVISTYELDDWGVPGWTIPPVLEIGEAFWVAPPSAQTWTRQFDIW